MGFHLTNLILIAGGLLNRFHPNEVENARVGCEFTAPASLCWSPTASMPSAMDWGDISRVGGVSPKTEASSTGGKGSALPCTVCEHSQSLTWSTSSVKGKFAVGCSIIDRIGPSRSSRWKRQACNLESVCRGSAGETFVGHELWFSGGTQQSLQAKARKADHGGKKRGNNHFARSCCNRHNTNIDIDTIRNRNSTTNASTNKRPFNRQLRPQPKQRSPQARLRPRMKQESKTKVLLMSKQRTPETEHFASDQTSTAQGISGGPHTVLLLASSHTAWETSRVWCDCLQGKSGQCGHVMALLLLLCCDQFQPNAFAAHWKTPHPKRMQKFVQDLQLMMFKTCKKLKMWKPRPTLRMDDDNETCPAPLAANVTNIGTLEAEQHRAEVARRIRLARVREREAARKKGSKV